MRTISSTEAKILRKILLSHDALTLSPDCDDHPKLNIILGNLRGFLQDIGDGALQAREDGIKALGQLIGTEDRKMEAMRALEPESEKVNEQFCYILGLAKALSMVQGELT